MEKVLRGSILIVIVVVIGAFFLMKAPDVQSAHSPSPSPSPSQCIECCRVGGRAGNCKSGSCKLCPSAKTGYLKGDLDDIRAKFKKLKDAFDCKHCDDWSKLFDSSSNRFQNCKAGAEHDCKLYYRLSCSASCN